MKAIWPPGPRANVSRSAPATRLASSAEHACCWYWNGKDAEISSCVTHPGIIDGVDGSTCARAAVRWAAQEAGMCKVPLTVVHVCPCRHLSTCPKRRKWWWSGAAECAGPRSARIGQYPAGSPRHCPAGVPQLMTGEGFDPGAPSGTGNDLIEPGRAQRQSMTLVLDGTTNTRSVDAMSGHSRSR